MTRAAKASAPNPTQNHEDTERTDPVLVTPPEVTIGDRTYALKRLGLRHVFKVLRILGRGVQLLNPKGGLTAVEVLQVLVASISVNETEVLSLLADLLDVRQDELTNADLFPADALIVVLEALAEHPDLQSFLKRLQAMAPGLLATATA